MVGIGLGGYHENMLSWTSPLHLLLSLSICTNVFGSEGFSEHPGKTHAGHSRARGKRGLTMGACSQATPGCKLKLGP